MRLLILGGTSEASALARALAGRPDIAPLLSLAGRTEQPAPPPIPFRTGGFGGAEGLAAFLEAGRFDLIIDATHPFAARISANAAIAAAHVGIPSAVLTRPSWVPQPGDRWRGVTDLDAAALALGEDSRRVFLTSGRFGLSAFRQAPQHSYLVRSIDPPAPMDCPPKCEILLARGPFDAGEEEALMRRHRIEVLVSKNSGGTAGAAKLDAARSLRIPVVMVERPERASGTHTFYEVESVLGWIEDHRPTP